MIYYFLASDSDAFLLEISLRKKLDLVKTLMSPQNFTKSVLYCDISKFLIFSAMSMSLKIANEWSGDDGEEASL